MDRLMAMTVRCAPLVLLVALSTAVVADPLEQMIGADHAQAMGLQKLSAEERVELARWIERHLEGRPVPVTMPTVEFAFDGVTVQATLVPLAPAAMAAAAPASALERVAVPQAPVAIGSAGAFGLEQSAVDGEVQELHARVIGAFTGWDGKTQFKLDNGQTWRQSTSGVYRYKATDPEVVIEKSLLGYKLRLVDTRRSIAVRRVK